MLATTGAELDYQAESAKQEREALPSESAKPSFEKLAGRARVIASHLVSIWRNTHWAWLQAWKVNRFLTMWLTAALFVQSVIPAAQALALRGLINAAVLGSRHKLDAMAQLLPWLVFTFAAALLDGLNRTGQDYANQRLEDDLNVELSSTILARAGDLDLRALEDPKQQDALYRARDDPAGNVARFLIWIFAAASDSIQVLSLAAIITAIEPLALILVIPLVLPYLRFQWGLEQTRYELELARAVKRRWTQYFSAVLLSAAWGAEVKTLGLAPLLVEKFRSLMSEIRDQDHRISKRRLRGASLFSTISSASLFLFFARLAYRVLLGSATLGDLAIFAAAAARLRLSLDALITRVALLAKQMQHVSVVRMLASKAETAITSHAITAARCRGEIEIDAVSFTYSGSTKPALYQVSLTIRAGETIALFGENGSGKSTLVKIIAGLYDPDRGCVRIDGKDLRSYDPEELREQLSIVFQNFGQYEATVAENIAYGDWRRLVGDDQAIRKIAEQTGAAELIRELPKRYQTPVGQRFSGADLSVGQWQQIALARAFARRSSIVILDEPAANLDARAERDLLLRYRALAAGRTTLLVSHRLATLRIADRIAVLHRGRLVEIGTHDELLSNRGQYAELCGWGDQAENGAR